MTCRKVNQDMYAQIFKLLTERPVTAHDISEKVGMHIVNAQGLMRTFKRHGVVHICSWRQDTRGRDATPVYELGEGFDKPRRKKTDSQRAREYREKLMSDKRFCTGCQVDRPKEGGVMAQCGKVRRWKCQMCIEKKAISPYTKKEKNEHSHA
jgi:hypothetical protein